MHSLFTIGLLVATVLSPSLVGSTGCPSKLDLVFVVDGSGSIEYNNWMIMQDFLVQVINRLNIRRNQVRAAMVLYSTRAYIPWSLSDAVAQDAGALSTAISLLPYLNGRTATPAGLQMASQILRSNGQRDNVQNVVVVITDGRANEYEEYFEQTAQELKNISRVVAIGITNDIDYNELNAIATTPCDVYTVDDFNQMDDDMDATMDFICGCVPGYRLDADTCDCTACGVDMYQPMWGQTQCMDCPHGQGTLDGMAAVQCQDDCPAGSRIKDDGTGCELCDVGYYQPGTAQSACLPCPTGYSTRGVGATTEAECELVCDSGEYPEQVNGATECKACPPGTYQPGVFATMCIQCPPGYNTRQVGSTLREQCEIECGMGEEPNENGTACVPCERGFYQPSVFQHQCEPCPVGHSTRMPGATSRDQCQVVCGPGEYPTDVGGQMECVDCPVGTYQPGSFSTMCIECPDGYSTKRAKTTELEDCEIVCGVGEEPNENGTACQPCPIGTYQDEEFGKQCLTCPPGESTRREGARHIDFCEDLNPPQERSESNGGASNAGAIAGAVVGALLLVALLVILAFLLLRLRRKKAYAQSEDRALGVAAPVIGKMEKGLYDNGKDKGNHYDSDPTAKSPYDNKAASDNPYDNGPNTENPYDNGPHAENPYDNGSRTENPYDNGSRTENPYDNGSRTENPYDNLNNAESPYDNGSHADTTYDNGRRIENPYDNGDTTNTVYDNSRKSALDNVYDNSEDTENVYNNIGDVENPYEAEAAPSENPYEVPIQVKKGVGLDNPVYTNTS